MSKNGEKRDNKGKPCDGRAKQGNAASSCPKKAKNDTSWYTKSGIKFVGPNFTRLADVKPSPGVGYPGGVTTSRILHAWTAPVLPADENMSFSQAMTQFYQDIRSRNSGAANYTPLDVGLYFANLHSFHVAAEYFVKVAKAMKSSNAYYKVSPHVYAAAAGVKDYADLAEEYGNFVNALTIFLKDLDTMPCPEMSLFDRSHFMYGSMFRDNDSPRAAILSFNPAFIPFYHIVKPSDATRGEGRICFESEEKIWDTSVMSALSNLRAKFRTFSSDAVNAIIRGDIINRFGDRAWLYRTSGMLETPLQDGVSPAIHSQLRNMTVLPNVNVMTFGSFYDFDAQYTFGDASVLGGDYCEWRNSGVVDAGLTFNGQGGNYFVDIIEEGDPGEDLLTYTRMMVRAHNINGASASLWRVTSHSGNVVLGLFEVTNMDEGLINSTFVKPLYQAIGLIQKQSSFVDLQYIANTAMNVDFFPPVMTEDEAGTADDSALLTRVANWGELPANTLSELTQIANRSMYSISFEGLR